jgi:hypothetical protein
MFPGRRSDAGAQEPVPEHRRMFHVLRIAAAMCFIGHGAFGLIGKAGWVPYFRVVGIDAGWAFSLMPVVGLVDILLGVSVLVWPTRAACAYMALWGLWTALLRPLANQGLPEALERAGNYGVPLALLLVGLHSSTRGGWFARMTPPVLDAQAAGRIAWVLRATTATLLLGHGLLAAAGKPLLLLHLFTLGIGNGDLSTTATMLARQGGFEIAVAVAVLLAPGRNLLLFACLWKVATELLFPWAGDSAWEFVERGGSYGAPLALMLMMRAGLVPVRPEPLTSSAAPA